MRPPVLDRLAFRILLARIWNRRGALRRRNAAYMRLWMGRLIFWLGAVGVGLAAVSFAKLTDHAIDAFHAGANAAPWLPFLLTPLAGIGCVFLTRRLFSGAEGSGIPQVIAEVERQAATTRWQPLVSLRIALGKIALGVGAVGSGFSMGREGPTVQIGASLMGAVSRFLPVALHIQRRHLLIAGGAAGIAAAFNTPLAGVIFAIEELNRGIETRMSGLAITAIVLAGVVAQALLGHHNYFGKVVIGEDIPNTQLLIAVLLCVAISGAAGGLFSRMLVLAASEWKGRLPAYRKAHPCLFAGGCGLLIAALGWVTGGITFCSGYSETRFLLEGGGNLPWYFGIGKFVATLVSYLSGLPGGIFAPSLAIGAGLGNNLIPFFGHELPPVLLLILCMVGFLAAATQAPITSFIIVMEMVDGYPVVMALMATALLASGISRTLSRPLYHALAENMLQRQHAPSTG